MCYDARMTLEKLKKLNMPGEPGVYFWKKGKDILYIGKATSLRDRVRSYLTKDVISARGQAIVDMAFKADTVEWQTTETVLEALILEASLIKSHQPYYNVKEKDDKSWNYVLITDDVLPLVIVERGKNINFKTLETKQYSIKYWYGPFTNGMQLREAMKIIRRIFPFFDASSIKKQNKVFYEQVGLAPSATDDYKKNIRNLNLFFQGKKKEVMKNFEKEMKAFAKVQAFEKAEAIKKQLFALTHINDIALLKKELSEETDGKQKFRVEAYDIAHTSGKQMVGVMTVITNGVPDKAEYRKFNIMSVDRSNDPAALGEVLRRRLGHPGWDLPQLIVVDGNDVQKNVAEKVLLKYGYNIPVVAVIKNDAHKARAFLGEQGIIMAHSNAILLANAEAHRFAIGFHRKKRGKQFLK